MIRVTELCAARDAAEAEHRKTLARQTLTAYAEVVLQTRLFQQFVQDFLGIGEAAK